MNKKQLLPAFLMLLTSVSGAQAQGKSGIDLKNFDRSVRPADDFYEFATGGWQKKMPFARLMRPRCPLKSGVAIMSLYASSLTKRATKRWPSACSL